MGRCASHFRASSNLLVADAVSVRLGQLKRDHARLRIDLSAVDFIDSSGLRAIIRAVGDGAADGPHRVEVDPQVSQAVRRLLHLVGLDSMVSDAEVR